MNARIDALMNHLHTDRESALNIMAKYIASERKRLRRDKHAARVSHLRVLGNAKRIQLNFTHEVGNWGDAFNKSSPLKASFKIERNGAPLVQLWFGKKIPPITFQETRDNQWKYYTRNNRDKVKSDIAVWKSLPKQVRLQITERFGTNYAPHDNLGQLSKNILKNLTLHVIEKTFSTVSNITESK